MKNNLLHYQRAIFLRKKKGYSYKEILAEVPVAKSTLSLWLRNITLSPKQQARLKNKRPDPTVWNLAEWNRAKRQQEIINIRNKARSQVEPLTKHEFFIVGLMLYWAEGAKGGGEVRFSNSDPLMIQYMMQWFREFSTMPEEKFRIALHYHQGQDEMVMKQYWSDITGIPLSQFVKSFCKPPGTGHRTHILHFGTIQIRIYSADLFHRMVGWREGLIEPVISGKNITPRP